MFCRFGLFPGATDQGHDWGAKKYSDLAEGHDGVESTAIHPKPTASSRIFLDIVPSNCNRPRHTSACMLMEYTSTAGTDTVDFRNRHANGLVRSLTQTLADSSLCTSPPRLFQGWNGVVSISMIICDQPGTCFAFLALLQGKTCHWTWFQ